MKWKVGFLAIFAGLVAVLLTACSTGSAQGNGAPRAVEAYLNALVANDANKALNLTCAAYEADAKMEIASFGAVKAHLQDTSCKQSGTDGQYTLVSCSGAIVANYNGEDQEIKLAERTFQAVQEGGEWRMCGYH